jgi:hypothetical protein
VLSRNSSSKSVAHSGTCRAQIIGRRHPTGRTPIERLPSQLGPKSVKALKDFQNEGQKRLGLTFKGFWLSGEHDQAADYSHENHRNICDAEGRVYDFIISNHFTNRVSSTQDWAFPSKSGITLRIIADLAQGCLKLCVMPPQGNRPRPVGRWRENHAILRALHAHQSKGLNNTNHLQNFSPIGIHSAIINRTNRLLCHKQRP